MDCVKNIVDNLNETGLKLIIHSCDVNGKWPKESSVINGQWKKAKTSFNKWIKNTKKYSSVSLGTIHLTNVSKDIFVCDLIVKDEDERVSIDALKDCFFNIKYFITAISEYKNIEIPVFISILKSSFGNEDDWNIIEKYLEEIFDNKVYKIQVF